MPQELETIVLASPRGFCPGVENAIRAVEQALDCYGQPVYVLHEIVHNSHVVSSLTEKGAVFVESLANVPKGGRLIFSAHGVSPTVRERAILNGLQVIGDATCSVIAKIHRKAAAYAGDGYSLLFVGHKGHPEVEGITGEAPEATYLIGSIADAQDVQIPDTGKVACLTQTTLSLDETVRILNVLNRRFPSLALPPKGDICYATQERQRAVKQLAPKVELMLIVGSRNSSNSNRLAEVARASCTPACLINDHTEIDPDLLKGVKAVGLTSGASAPEYLISQVVGYLKRIAPCATVTEMRAVAEK